MEQMKMEMVSRRAKMGRNAFEYVYVKGVRLLVN
jgi:hypothetical protein